MMSGISGRVWLLAVMVLTGVIGVSSARAELRAAWEFNSADVSGTSVSASGGTAANTTGTLIAEAAATNGVLTLGASTNYLAFGTDVTGLRNLSAMTICAWVRAADSATTMRRIVEHDDNFYLYQDAGRYRFVIHGVGGASLTSTTAPAAGSWQHVTAVWQRNNTAKIYVNGIPEATVNNPTVAMPNNAQRLSFGAQRNNSATPTPGAFYRGDMDDVAVWNTVLPQHQIEALAGRGLGGYGSRAVPLALESVTALKATGVRKDAATLNVRLGPTNYSPAEVWAYWGTADGGTDAALWANTNALGTCGAGIVSTNLAGLAANVTYHYRFCSAIPGAADPNARIWSAATRTFTTWRYQPDEIGDLQLWLKADDGVYLDAGTAPATNGSAVTQWNDWSGNGRAATRLGASNNVTYACDSLNEMPVIRMTDISGAII